MLNKLIVKESNFIKNAITLISGTVIAQLIPVLIQPIIKRLYTAEDFGVLDIYLKIIGILFVIFSFKYDLGIVLPKNKVKALLLLNLSVIFSLFFSFIIMLVIVFFSKDILILLKIPEKYKATLYILPISTLFFSLYNAFNYLLIREEKFKASSINKINRRAIEGGAQTGLFFLNNGIGLFIGNLLGNVIYFFSAYWQSFKKFKIDKRLFKYNLLKHIAKEYSDLPKYNILPELLNVAFLSAVSFIILTKFDIQKVGFMELTQRILAIPSAFIAYSLGQVLLQKTSNMISHKQKILPSIKKVFYYVFTLSIPFALIILLFAESIFKFVFGDIWEVSGTYSKYLILFYISGFIVSPLSQVLISLKEFRINAIWKIGRFILIFPLFFINFKNIELYLLSFSAIGTISYLVYLWIIFYYVKKYDNSINV